MHACKLSVLDQTTRPGSEPPSPCPWSATGPRSPRKQCHPRSRACPSSRRRAIGSTRGCRKRSSTYLLHRTHVAPCQAASTVAPARFMAAHWRAADSQWAVMVRGSSPAGQTIASPHLLPPSRPWPTSASGQMALGKSITRPFPCLADKASRGSSVHPSHRCHTTRDTARKNPGSRSCTAPGVEDGSRLVSGSCCGRGAGKDECPQWVVRPSPSGEAAWPSPLGLGPG